MKTHKTVYWVSTGIISLMMLFSAYGGLTDPHFAEDYKHLGFPSYFRIELAIAKIIGVIVLLVPKVSLKVKEWAYAGFGITFISSSIAHAASDDSAGMISAGIVFFALLMSSNIFYFKVQNKGIQTN